MALSLHGRWTLRLPDGRGARVGQAWGFLAKGKNRR
jgi:hypothetical protein